MHAVFQYRFCRNRPPNSLHCVTAIELNTRILRGWQDGFKFILPSAPRYTKWHFLGLLIKIWYIVLLFHACYMFNNLFLINSSILDAEDERDMCHGNQSRTFACRSWVRPWKPSALSLIQTEFNYIISRIVNCEFVNFSRPLKSARGCRSEVPV
jgi:hypothetical protein